MKKEETKSVIGYKAFDKGLKCRGFQYEVGKEYIYDGELKLCGSGLYFCKNPLDVLSYYNLVDSEFALVEATGETDSDDTKTVTDKLTIKAKLDLTAFVKASVEFVWNSCTEKSLLDKCKDIVCGASYKDGAQLASSGYRAQLASSGDGARLASSGYGAQLASSGDCTQLASSGDGAQLASSGDGAQLASSGYRAQLASSGYRAQLASSGDSARLASSGDSARLALDGKDSIGAGIGIRNVIKGKRGNWIVLAEYDENYKVVGVVSGKIDGNKIKEDTYYKAEGGEFVEA